MGISTNAAIRFGLKVSQTEDFSSNPEEWSNSAGL
jgi:hypothetical protein